MSQKGKHIVLWGGWYGSRNVGDQVLLLTITDILAGELGDVRFSVFTDNPDNVRTYTSRDSSLRFEAIHTRREFHRVVRALATCDLFIFGGGVPFYEEIDHLIAMGILVGLARLFGKPYMTWTVSSQIVTKPAVKRYIGWVLNGARAITYRDEYSHELFVSCGVKRPMYQTGDSGFRLVPAMQEVARELIGRAGEWDQARPLVGLTPRTLRGRDGDAETHYKAKTEQEYSREIESFVAALDYLWEKGYQPVMVPMNTVAPDDDRIACRRIMMEARHGSNAMLLDEEVRPRVAPAIYRECRASFVARVHGSITSMVGNCPVMMYSFAPKYTGIMKAMGLSDFVLEEEIATPKAAVAVLSALLENQEEVRKRMSARLIELRQEALLPARLAAQILGISQPSE
jgi:polysaccharide pyruvyl transferase WcaK-like protein